jgi:hypothetical protein
MYYYYCTKCKRLTRAINPPVHADHFAAVYNIPIKALCQLIEDYINTLPTDKDES